MGRREDLLRAEAQGWQQLNALVDSIRPDSLERPGLNDQGWAVRDLLWHVAFWCADAARVLEQIRRGAFEPRSELDDDARIDAINDRELERSRAMAVDEVRTEFHRARAAMLERFGELEELTADADEWFDESGPVHYAEHRDELARWVRASDP